MRKVILLALLAALPAAGCGRPAPPPAQPAPALPPVSGALTVAGLSRPVQIVRDRWGIPHIIARSTHDLFVAQGFVQAQDRLFQMDLWRRSVQGRLAQVLGPNFIDRDAMTRRLQYHGSLDAEWASYGADTRAIAEAFVTGVNAWVVVARRDPPEEFALAGWLPELWRPEDLLNRTDAFLASGDAAVEAVRAQLTASVGEARARALLPGATFRGAPPGLDLEKAGVVVGEALRRAGTPPFFLGFAHPITASLKAGTTGVGSNAWAIPASRSQTGAPIVANDPHRPLANPSLRYLVHLQAPGLNVIGATSPWLPGVVIGHNDRVAWGMAASSADTEDVVVEPASARVERIADPIVVKGEAKPFPFEREYTRNGVVIASDREHGLVFTLKWSGFAPGGAGELAALGLDRAGSAAALREALGRWRMPVVDVVFADAGGVGSQIAGADARARRHVSGGVVIAANESAARTNRLTQIFSGSSRFAIEDVQRQQRDVVAWNAAQLVPRLASLRSHDARVDAARQALLAWDRRVTADSPAAALYVAFERALWRTLAEVRVPATLVDDYLGQTDFDLAEALTADNALLLEALGVAASQPAAQPRRVLFTHPLAITAAARRVFDVGPFPQDGYANTVMASFTRSNVDVGASFREILDVADWDRSVATNAPGQSEWPRSPHFADLAKLWAAGEYFPLVFSNAAIQQNAESTLVLQPR